MKGYGGSVVLEVCGSCVCEVSRVGVYVVFLYWIDFVYSRLVIVGIGGRVGIV